MTRAITRYGVTTSKTRGVAYWQFWYVEPTTGKTKRESFGIKSAMSKTSANYRARDRVDEINRGGVPAAGGSMTLEAWRDKFLEDKANEIDEGTADSYRYAFKLAVNKLGAGLAIRAVTRDDAASVRAETAKMTKGKTKDLIDENTVRKHMGRLKAAFEEAAKRDLIPFNPFDRIKTSNIKSQVQWVYVSPEDARRMIEAAPDDRWRALIILARFVGFRANECWKAEWSDFSWSEKSVAVHPNSRLERTTTKAHPRVVPLVREAYDALLAIYERAPDRSTGPLDGLSTNNIRRQMQKIMARAKVATYPEPLQSLRASREMDWTRDRRIPERDVALWMGHAANVGRKFYHQTHDEVWGLAVGGPESAHNLPTPKESEPAG